MNLLMEHPGFLPLRLQMPAIRRHRTVEGVYLLKLHIICRCTVTICDRINHMKAVQVSVRSLVEFMLREGDIDNRRAHDPATAMLEGGRLHRKIQNAQGSEYHAEVPLNYVWLSDIMLTEGTTAIPDPAADVEDNTADSEDRVAIMVDGRADGIIDGDPVTIDEIKGTYRHLDKLDKPENVHLAQAKCYAYIYALQNEMEVMTVRMTYINMDSEEIKYYHYTYTFDELKEWFLELMRGYERWVRLELEWKNERNASIKTLEFPYEYRKGQKELVTHVYHTIAHGRKLFLEAPTGVGKTIATVFPAIKAMGEEKAGRLFYLTAKTITRTVARDTIELLRANGLHLKSIVLTAKDKICFMEERTCNPEACPYAAGHFDRINEALYAILTETVDYSRGTIEEYARRFRVCPFEFALDISLFADAVICDYNYLFDPHVYLKRFFATGKQADAIFLIDEAHNLIDRGRVMYSATLCKEDFLNLKKSVRVYDETLGKRLTSANKAMLSLKRLCAEPGKITSDSVTGSPSYPARSGRTQRYHILDDISDFVMSVSRLYERLLHFLENHDPSPLRDEVLDLTFLVSHFLDIYELMNDKYLTYGYMDDENDFYVRLYCVDPSDNLRECMKRGVSSILFSATLLPIQYYKSLLGGDPEDYEVYAESSFDPHKRGMYLADDVTTKYTERGPGQYERIAGHINATVSARPGNYMVFFPSYGFMEKVLSSYVNLYQGIKYVESEADPLAEVPDDPGDASKITISDSQTLLVQNSHMTEEEREDFLGAFAEPADASGVVSGPDSSPGTAKTLIGFCVLGGIFSEGIDLQGESLIGSIIVGTGIPMVCEENELIKEYFDERDGEGSGMRYAYVIPGFNKVLQAAGRVIRTHEDRGIVALLDYRFGYSSYRELYPREWNNVRRVSRDTVTAELKDFWEK